MLSTVREKPIENDANNREQEDQQTPEHLMRYWAVGSNYFDCCELVRGFQFIFLLVERRRKGLPITMTSRMNTMNPTIPPPVPYCHASPWPSTVIGAAMARDAIARWRTVVRRLKVIVATRRYRWVDSWKVDTGCSVGYGVVLDLNVGVEVMFWNKAERWRGRYEEKIRIVSQLAQLLVSADSKLNRVNSNKSWSVRVTWNSAA